MDSRLAALLAVVLLAAATPASAQHAPLVAEELELGGELILNDDLVGGAAVLLVPLNRTLDIRFGGGVADPDNGDLDGLIRTGLRAVVSENRTRLPLATAVEGQLDFFLGENNTVRLMGGPSFGVARARGGAVLGYAQGLFIFEHLSGVSDVKLGIRLGADYRRSDVVDLRGDFILSSQMQLRAAIFFRPGRI